MLAEFASVKYELRRGEHGGFQARRVHPERAEATSWLPISRVPHMFEPLDDEARALLAEALLEVRGGEAFDPQRAINRGRS